MGNATSHPQSQSPAHQNSSRRHSNSPSPLGRGPHRSLRTKKKSLELPDLASLSITPHLPPASSTPAPRPAPPKTASIPIPTSPEQELQARERQREKIERGRDRQIQNGHVVNVDSAADVLQEPSTHLPFPPPARGAGAPTYFRGAPRGYAGGGGGGQYSARQHAATARIQELYNQSQSPALTVPPPSPTNNTPVQTHVQQGYVRETVHSSIPLALPRFEQGFVQQDLGLEDDDEENVGKAPGEEEPVAVKITWRGGGRIVLLARAGDDDWKGRLPMERESPTSQTFTSTVTFPPGTHHFRFLVDDVWRVSDAYPTAVDDQGSLANYVNVAPTSPPSPSPRKHPLPGQSFWAPSEEDERERERERERELKKLGMSAYKPDPNTRWTSELPQELIEAAKEEEAYLLASSGHGTVNAPNIPPAPGLPRYLDKLILNTRSVASGGSQGGSPAKRSTGREREKEREREREKEREKERRDTRRDREGRARGREGRSGVPPAPPPSEVGDWEEEKDKPVVPTTIEEDAAPTPAPAEPHAHPLLPSHIVSGSRAITLDATTMPPLTDDASVLPVPSHVVLHHLSTSAIRNGVLAVGNTTRYRKKFLTTIYYKPT